MLYDGDVIGVDKPSELHKYCGICEAELGTLDDPSGYTTSHPRLNPVSLVNRLHGFD